MYEIKCKTKQVEENLTMPTFSCTQARKHLAFRPWGILWFIKFWTSSSLAFSWSLHSLNIFFRSSRPVYITHSQKKNLTTNLTINSIWKYYYQYIDNKMNILLQISTKIFSYNNNRDQNSNQNGRWDYWFHFQLIYFFTRYSKKNYTPRIC